MNEGFEVREVAVDDGLENGLSFFVEARVVGERSHFKILLAPRIGDDQSGSGAQDFLGEDGAGVLKIDEIDVAAELVRKDTGEMEAFQRFDGARGEEGDIDVAAGVGSGTSVGAEKVDRGAIQVGQGMGELRRI